MDYPTTILITGATSGLGKALAYAYASPGTTLYLTGRDHNRLSEIVSTCQTAGAEVFSHALDICDAHALKCWIIEVDTNRPIDLCIANAGISAGTGDKGEGYAQAKGIFDINVGGVLNTIHPVMEQMIERKSGHIALMSSLSAFRGLPSAPAYSASKAAVKTYGEALRGTLQKHGVDVSVICPGYIKTPMTSVNTFPMPLLMEVDKAANLIKRRLQKKPARIAFPFPLYALIWLLGTLPPRLTDPLFSRLPNKPSA